MPRSDIAADVSALPTLAAARIQAACLGQWLRLLWRIEPSIHLSSEQPFIANAALHLPPARRWRDHCAAAAHAAAHLVYSPQGYDGEGLVPLARALLGLLEDARVEALAVRELPGLARLWLPQHTASPEDGAGSEALLGRLARALIDPSYQDPHAWVAKGRRLFWLDAHGTLLALRTPAEVRNAALILGRDLGQMRLPFNARGYRPSPSYRDDHRWMWAADQLEPQAGTPDVPPESDPFSPERPAPEVPETDDDLLPEHVVGAFRYPEWDHRIRRARPDWARVVVHEVAPAFALAPAPVPAPAMAPARATAPAPASNPAPDPARVPARASATGYSLPIASPGLLDAVRAALSAPAPPRRSAEGDVLDLDGALRWQVARRLGRGADARVFRTTSRGVAGAELCLLIDASVSSADRLAPGGPSLLQLAQQAALRLVAACQALQVRCGVAAFSSYGRHEVHWSWLKRPGLESDPLWVGRLHRLRSQGSTRLGAALRHATAQLARPGATRAQIWLLSDGAPHDIDSHEPRYLVADACQAVQAATRRAVRVVCLRLAAADDAQRVARGEARKAGPSGPAGSPQPVFRRSDSRTLSRLDALPQIVASLR